MDEPQPLQVELEDWETMCKKETKKDKELNEKNPRYYVIQGK